MRSINVYFTPPHDPSELSPGTAGKYRICGDNSRRSFTHCFDIFTRRKPKDSFELAFLSQLICFKKMVLDHGMAPDVADEAMQHFPEYYSECGGGSGDSESARAYRHRLSNVFHKAKANAQAHAEATA